MGSLLFLPKYGPEQSPIELCRGKMKNYPRALEARTLERREAAVGDTMSNITAADANGWVRHRGYG